MMNRGLLAAVQVAYSLSNEARSREVGNLVRLHQLDDKAKMIIVTMFEQASLIEEGVAIEVIPAWKFLLNLADAMNPCT